MSILSWLKDRAKGEGRATRPTATPSCPLCGDRVTVGFGRLVCENWDCAWAEQPPAPRELIGPGVVVRAILATQGGVTDADVDEMEQLTSDPSWGGEDPLW